LIIIRNFSDHLVGWIPGTLEQVLLRLVVEPAGEKTFLFMKCLMRKGGMIMNQLQEVLGTEPWGPFHILLMEDELSMANGLKMVLQEEGYDVDLAMTGQTALDKFNRKSFDLLVDHLRLPDIDVMEVIKQLK
jgi:PleD family two-component response regulator